jgi:hypothetical protein
MTAFFTTSPTVPSLLSNLFESWRGDRLHLGVHLYVCCHSNISDSIAIIFDLGAFLAKLLPIFFLSSGLRETLWPLVHMYYLGWKYLASAWGFWSIGELGDVCTYFRTGS